MNHRRLHASSPLICKPRCSGPTWTTRCPSSCLARFPTCATVSSRCTAGCCMRCTTVGIDRTVTFPRAPALSVTSWATTTRMATVRFTTPSSDSRNHGVFGTRSCKARGTSVHPETTRPQPSATPNAGWPSWPWRRCEISMKRPSTLHPTTTVGPSSPPFCPAGSRTCWSTEAPASLSAWPPTSRPTTYGKSPRRRRGC